MEQKNNEGYVKVPSVTTTQAFQEIKKELSEIKAKIDAIYKIMESSKIQH